MIGFMNSFNKWLSLPIAMCSISVFGQVLPQDLQYCRDLKEIVKTKCEGADKLEYAKCVSRLYERNHNGCNGISLKTNSGLLKCIEEFNYDFNQQCVINSPSRLAAESEVDNLLNLIEDKFLVEQVPLKVELANTRLKQDKVVDLLNKYNNLSEQRASETEKAIAQSLGYKTVFEKWASRLNNLLVQANGLSSMDEYQPIYLKVKEIQLSSKKELNIHRNNFIGIKAKNKDLERSFYQEVSGLDAGDLFKDNVLALNSVMLDLTLNEIQESKFTLDRHVDYVLLMLGAKRSALLNIQNEKEFNSTIQTALYLERTQSYLNQMNSLAAKITRPERSNFFNVPFQAPLYETAMRVVDLNAMCESGGVKSWHSLGCNAVKLQLRRAEALLGRQIKSRIQFSVNRMTDLENPDQLMVDKTMLAELLNNDDIKNASKLFDTLLERYGSE